MKRCPECRRDYTDETLNFCLDDGTPLLDGARTVDDVPTRSLPTEAPTITFRSKIQQGTTPADSVAVLPFVNLSADPENEYFCDGLAEEILNALTKIGDLKVAARTSAFSFKDKNIEASKIGSALNVRTILEGSVRKAGDRVRISVQLVNASDGFHIWSERYDRELRDIFEVQDDITLAVVSALKIRLLGQERSLLIRRHTDSTEAYQLYLRGRFVWNKRTEDAIRKGIEYFNRAIEHDPNFAMAYTGLSDCYTLLVVREAISPYEGFAEAKKNAEAALRIDPTLGQALASLGHALLHNWEWEAAEVKLTKALELKPDYPSAHQWYSEYLTAMGRHQESITELQLAVQLDPLSLVISADLGRAFYYARRYDEVFEQEARTLEMDPRFWLSRINLGRSYIQTGDHDRAVDELRKACAALPGSTEAKAFLGFAYAAANRHAEASEVLAELRAKSIDTHVPPYHFAVLFAGLGDNGSALENLENAYEKRSVDFFTLNAEPMFDGLRSDPRFTKLLKKTGFIADSEAPSTPNL